MCDDVKIIVSKYILQVASQTKYVFWHLLCVCVYLTMLSVAKIIQRPWQVNEYGALVE